MAVLLLAQPARAGLHHAALVIEHSSGRILARCVAFTESQITGLQLIQRSGVQYQGQSFGSLGSAMCQLDGEPSAVPSDCFGSGPYWQYFHRAPNGWGQSPMGASAWSVRDGDMDGWHYAAGAAQPPPALAYSSVCAPAAAVAPATAAATPAPRPPVAASATVTAIPPPATTASQTPSIVALAPSWSATPTRRSASELASRSSVEAPGLPIAPLVLFAGSAVVLSGLFAWNLRRRRR